MEYDDESMANELWNQLLVAVIADTSIEDKPRWLALANFRVPGFIPDWESQLAVRLTGAILHQNGNNACAALLAPEYPISGRRKEDIKLVQVLHDNAARGPSFFFTFMLNTNFNITINRGLLSTRFKNTFGNQTSTSLIR